MIDSVGYASVILDSTARSQLSERIRQSTSADTVAFGPFVVKDSTVDTFFATSTKHRIGDINKFLDQLDVVLKPLREALTASRQITHTLQTAKTIVQAALALEPELVIPASPTSSGLLASDASVRVAGYASFRSDTVAGAVGNRNVGSSDNLSLDAGVDAYQTLTIEINGESNTITFGTLANQVNTAAELETELNAIDGIGAGYSAQGLLVIVGSDAETSFTVDGTANVRAAFGIAKQTYAPTNLLSQGLSQNDTLTFQVGDGAVQTITFGAGSGEVATLGQLRTELSALSGVVAYLDSSNRLAFIAVDTIDTVVVGGTADIGGNFGIARGQFEPGVAVQDRALTTTRSSLQAEYNAIVLEVDRLVAGANYRGVNFFSGDTATIRSPSNADSTYTLGGHNVSSATLGLQPVGGDGFQTDQVINDTLNELDAALGVVEGVTANLNRDRAILNTESDAKGFLSKLLGDALTTLTVSDLDQQQAQRVALDTKLRLASFINNQRVSKGDVHRAANPTKADLARPLLPGLIGDTGLTSILLRAAGKSSASVLARTILSA